MFCSYKIKILYISRTAYMKIAVLFRDTNDLINAATCKTGKKYDPRLGWGKLEQHAQGSPQVEEPAERREFSPFNQLLFPSSFPSRKTHNNWVHNNQSLQK